MLKNTTILGWNFDNTQNNPDHNFSPNAGIVQGINASTDYPVKETPQHKQVEQSQTLKCKLTPGCWRSLPSGIARLLTPPRSDRGFSVALAYPTRS